MSFRASASSWIIFLNAQIMPNLLNTSSLRVGDADHGLRALLYPNLQGKTFSTAVAGWGRWGSYGPLSAADTKPPPSSAVSFFFATWPFLAIRNVRVLGFTTTDDDDDDDETGLPPLNPLVLRTENRQNFIANFFWRF